MKIVLLLFSLLMSGWNGFGQAAINEVLNERNFALQVKQLDEFIERFNFDKGTLLVEYLQKKYPSMTIDRSGLIQTLFNNQNTKISKLRVKEFATDIADSVKGGFINYDDDDWYAEIICKFRYRNNIINVNLILQMENSANGGSKWMIDHAYSASLPTAKYPGNGKEAEQVKRKFINPISHTTDFIGLAKAFGDKGHFYDYLGENFFSGVKDGAFLNAYLKGELQFLYIHSIKYHFLQLPGWIFSVENFERDTANSGWLINDIKESSDEEKIKYKQILFKTTLKL